ncbi:MAG: histidinol-phosphate transaminase [Acidobacteria bacterium]|nr:histidinol-phosphate transaminase [Acidobacteriota bacterium]
MIEPRKAILEMPEYHPPLAGREHALRLDFNENTFAPSPRVMDVIKNITAEDLTVYPEREPRERIAAKHLGLAPEQVLLTNAVDEAIHIITYTFLNEGDEALFAVPSFFMYDVNVQAMGAKAVRVQSDDSLRFPFGRILKAITPKTKLIILCTPNNPTGGTIAREQILAIAKAAPQAVIFVDEAYYHFFGETVIGDIGKVPNIILARTFSKAYGLANLRVGLIAGPADLMKHMRKAASPYNVNGVALRCLEAAMADEEYVAWYTQQIKTGREKLAAALRELEIPFWPSAANFILTRIGPRHKNLVAAMKAKGVLLRDRSADPGLAGCVRITVGVEEQNARCIAALREAVDEIDWQPAEAKIPDIEDEDEREYE